MGGAGHSIIEMIFGACECTDTFNCSSTLDKNGGIVLWLAIMIYMFKALGTVCDEYFVPSLEMISEKLQLSNDVAGATFMAAGSSAPELFTSLVATFLIVNEGGVGTIIGSAIFNILVIVGATCCFAGQELEIWWYPLARDCSFYVLAIAQLSIVLIDSEVMWYEGLVMFITYIGYIGFMKINYKIVKALGGEPGDKVEDLEDPEKGGDSSKPESEAAEKPEKSTQGEGPRDAAKGATQETSQPESAPKVIEVQQPKVIDVQPETEVAPKVQSGNPNSPDDEENSSKAKDTKADNAASNGDQAASTPEIHAGKAKLDLPTAETSGASKGSPRGSPRGSLHGEGSHKIWSMHELNHEHHHNHHDKEAGEHTDGQVASSTAEAKEGAEDAEKADAEEEKEGRQYDPLLLIWGLIMPTPERYWLLFSASIGNIALCTYLMVDAVNRTGCNLGIKPLIMGLIFLAAGTSVPDALGSIAVAKQGEGDMAVANAFGSNVFDILLGLGVPWFISTALLQKRVVFPGAGGQLLEWIIILTAILVLFIGALVANKWKLNKKMGVILMGFYVVYVIFALIRAFVAK